MPSSENVGSAALGQNATEYVWVQRLAQIGKSLSEEQNLEALLEGIIDGALSLTNADGVSLYMLQDNALHFTISKNISLGISLGGASGAKVNFPPVPLDPTYVAAYTAIHKKTVNIPDVYASTEFDFTGPKTYDKQTGYRSVSMLVTPLLNQSKEVSGVLQLLNAIDPATNHVVPFQNNFIVLAESLASQAAVSISYFERTKELREANLDAIYALAVAAEAKDDDTGNHVYRIQSYSYALCNILELPEATANEIGYSSIMHDVGKISVPDSILKKPGKLDEQEFKVMRTHAIRGERILPDKPFFNTARQIARSHHEKYDGSGYPDNLSRGDIPLCARIVAVADVFDALTNSRCYKKAWPMEDAVAEIMRCSGQHFDPDVSLALDEMWRTGEATRIWHKWKG